MLNAVDKSRLWHVSLILHTFLDCASRMQDHSTIVNTFIIVYTYPMRHAFDTHSCNAFSANCSVNAILSCIKHFFWVLQGGVVNMEEEFLSLGLDIIGLGVFNYKFGSITTESPVIKVGMDHARVSLVVNNRIRRLMPGLYLHT